MLQINPQKLCQFNQNNTLRRFANRGQWFAAGAIR
jgi:hypothetical protein